VLFCNLIYLLVMNRPFPDRLVAIAGATLLLVMFPFIPTPSWGCTTGGGGGFSYGSQTGGGAVTVCARAVVETRTTAVVKSAPKPVVVPKPVAAPKPAPKPISVAPKPAPKQAVKPVTKTPPKVFFTPVKLTPPPALLKPVTKPVVKPPVKPKSAVPAKPVVKAPVNVPIVIAASNSSTGQASFSPAPLHASASLGEVEPGETVIFSADPMVHYRSGVILEKATDVRFVPVSITWSFGDGGVGDGSAVSHAFATSGQYLAVATAVYSVSYQIAGQSGWVEAGPIAVSDSVSILVSQNGSPADGPTAGQLPPVARLVGKNCFADAAAYGCTA
jgi:hypothetical protein